ncbi:hypothetical protein CNYM01_06991 [Colletotrichum nymphaeae SA-01]|uniref:Uncharacterized protein n=1 Tax=Colletotrichum nymphaeae SA-01 TaxID=1460502 RepID=A0A135TMA6_9PEZI|nr:hypothetical protein CNYM01_06991 [Colletotrichum nymphaeae SA-01]
MYSPIPKKAYMYGMTDNVNYPLETSPPPAYSELQPYVPPQVSIFDMNDVHEALPQVSKGKTKCFPTWANDEVRRETDWDADLRLARYIFEEFKYDENLIPRDVADCLRVYSLFSPGPDGQIKQIDNFVGHKALKRFYRTNATCGDSWSIHLHGNGSEVAVNPNGITTFSYIAALVTRKLTTAPGHFVLTWFCAKLDCHSAERYRPKAMMASFLCQLLDKMTKAGLKLNLRTSPFV